MNAGGVIFQTPFVQKFKLKGKKVKGKQVLDVNLIVNASGSAADALQELSAVLVAPKGENVLVLIPGIGHNQVNVKFDDQSELIPCNPLANNRRDCNYLSGADATGDFGTFTGSLNAGAGGVLVGFNATFKGLNPKGTWTLYSYDDERRCPEQHARRDHARGQDGQEVRQGGLAPRRAHRSRSFGKGAALRGPFSLPKSRDQSRRSRPRRKGHPVGERESKSR